MSEWIRVTVGGERFETLRSTLEQLEYFRVRLAEGRWSGKIKFDRDPKAFRALLNHLRDPRYLLPCKYWPELEFFDPQQFQIQVEPLVLPDSHIHPSDLPPVADTGGVLPIVANAASDLLGYVLPRAASRFITPLKDNEWPYRGAQRLPLAERVSFKLESLHKVDLFTGLELHLDRGVDVCDAVRSLAIFRGQQCIQRLDNYEVCALQQIHGKSRNVMRFLDFFGTDGMRIQARRLMFQEKDHFVDLKQIRWEIEFDLVKLNLNAAWLVESGVQIERPVDAAFNPLDAINLESSLVSLNYEFAMFPIMAKQVLLQTEICTVELSSLRGLLCGLVVLIRDGSRRHTVERIELVIYSTVIHTQLGSEHVNGVYEIKLNPLDMRRCEKFTLRIYALPASELTVIGNQRHYNFERFSYHAQPFPMTTFAPLIEKILVGK